MGVTCRCGVGGGKEAIDLAQKWEASRAALLQSLCNHNSSISQAAADALRNCSAAQKCNWRQDSLSLDLYHETPGRVGQNSFAIPHEAFAPSSNKER